MRVSPLRALHGLTLCDFGCNHEDPVLSLRRLDEDCDRIRGARQHVNATNSKQKFAALASKRMDE